MQRYSPEVGILWVNTVMMQFGVGFYEIKKEFVMAKKVNFGGRPVEKSMAVDQWVESREPVSVAGADEGVGVMKRLTIDLAEGLHKRVKAGCAMRGVKMADEIRRLLEANFPG